jgi:chromate reductase
MKNNNEKVKIVGLVGSLRKDSFNRSLMDEAVNSCLQNADIEIVSIELPLFNQDLESNLPAEVVEFKRKIKAADAVLIASPEYNYSVSGVLKNAIDWASRPYGDNSFEKKPVGIMSASIGMLGGARGQYHLRQSFVFLDAYPLNNPEVIVAFAQEKIKDGVVIDQKTKEKICEMVNALVDWTKKLRD